MPTNENQPCMAIIVMGVSSCGKSTIGAQLAAELGYYFEDGDHFHSQSNIDKMRSGIPLTDDDRKGWLETISNRLSEFISKHQGIIIACSALKRSYRNILRSTLSSDDKKVVSFVFIKGTLELFSERMKQRTGHFMPLSLLQSQFDTLQEPTDDEDSDGYQKGILVVADASKSVTEIVSDSVNQIRSFMEQQKAITSGYSPINQV